MPDYITSYEFERAMNGLREDNAAIREELVAGLAGVHTRLDKVNGHIEQHRTLIAGHDSMLADRSARLKSLEHEIFDRQRPQDTLPAEIAELVSTLKATKMLKAMVAGLIGIAVPLLGLALWAMQHIEVKP